MQLDQRTHAANRLDTAAQTRRFMLAGNAAVTLVSQKTGVRFTYRIRGGKTTRVVHFVELLIGPDNTRDYRFLGTIFDSSRYQRNGIPYIAASAKAFEFAWGHIAAGRMPPQCEVWHESRCGRCGRPLTVPESIAMGLGPECAQMGN